MNGQYGSHRITSGLPTRTPFKLYIGSYFHLSSQVLVETELFIMYADKQVYSRLCGLAIVSIGPD